MDWIALFVIQFMVWCQNGVFAGSQCHFTMSSFFWMPGIPGHLQCSSHWCCVRDMPSSEFELKVKCMEIHTLLCFTLTLPKLSNGQILLLNISTSVDGRCGFKLFRWGLVTELVAVLELIFNIYFKEVCNFMTVKMSWRKLTCVS